MGRLTGSDEHRSGYTAIVAYLDMKHRDVGTML